MLLKYFLFVQTALRAISEDQDTISFNSHFDDQRFQDTNASFNIVLSNWAINESSLSMDDEGTSELAAEIYELERNKLELGQMIGQVNSAMKKAIAFL